MKRMDLSGKKFGRWTVQSERIVRPPNQIMWRCICECGTDKYVSINTLKNGESKSCGCYRDDKASLNSRKHGFTKYKGGRSPQFPEYTTWASMKQRCYDRNNQSYPRYGGRGITVCDRWKNSFENFLEDMGCKPNPKMTIDRINNGGNYEPGNCKWSSRLEQSRNRMHVLKSLKEKAKIAGVDFESLKTQYVVNGLPLKIAIEFSDKV